MGQEPDSVTFLQMSSSPSFKTFLPGEAFTVFKLSQSVRNTFLTGCHLCSHTSTRVKSKAWFQK